MTQTFETLDQAAQVAIDALAYINAQRKAWTDNAKRGGYAAHFSSAPQISDDLHMALLDEVVFWDEDPKGSLEEMRFQLGMDNDGSEIEPATYGRFPRLSDEAFDYATSRGLVA